MNIEILDAPEQALIDFLDKKIVDFNWAHWEVSERKPLAIQIKDELGNIIAGSSARTFGNWLLINTLWVDESQRGKKMGVKILAQLETAAVARGCTLSMLDTLNFQAMPFYEKQGYQTKWVQENYPKTGCKYFMVKELTE
ncbi:N-acetyltransferase [Colwellia sp. MB3u-55]|uniref:GNAT family N-acetyltransferase n=1 Tax=Colwellia sp. MB3u-55 TaxID=2759810 RepID=UPI0015F3758C|nr:GNAT family N-acetyltransferase [Colwellia sp. MB3u-55]MBA6252421.1 GNAT family N-acetyltransferase [Colwellia sp. MB3u-55]